MKYIKIILFVSFTIFNGCDGDSNSAQNAPTIPTENLTGSGYFEYADYTPFDGRILKIHYHIPINTSSDTKILFVFHGNGRNAMDYRDAIFPNRINMALLLWRQSFHIQISLEEMPTT